MYYIGLDVHKKTISYCVKDASGQVHQEGKIGATRRELDSWIKTLPQPRTVAMEATIFTGWNRRADRMVCTRPDRGIYAWDDASELTRSLPAPFQCPLA
jgi:hypothetical protein